VTIQSGDTTDDQSRRSNDLARDMIEVYGDPAVAVARENARVAALAGDIVKARGWLRIVGCIQRQVFSPATRPAVALE
jgi:hypothetical protein